MININEAINPRQLDDILIFDQKIIKTRKLNPLRIPFILLFKLNLQKIGINKLTI